MKKTPIIISLGGSLIVPKTGIDVAFLKSFKAFIAKRVAKGERFVLICGGGSTARQYQKAAKDVGHLSSEDVDWIGIHSTRLNAHLLRTIFQKLAHSTVIKNPHAPPRFREPVLIAAGWKPGWSTDYCATLLASSLGATTVLNLSDIDYVYSADPRKNAKAKPLPKLDWKAFRKMIGNRWDPGANVPFDPVAAKLAQRLGLTVKMIKGRALGEISKALDGKAFKGTVIRD
ncbi:MAG: UMP kinase [Patescibacteria group bacterium]|nr:MAG: UMP kinase [Patescibacteria group bacterium]